MMLAPTVDAGPTLRLGRRPGLVRLLEIHAVALADGPATILAPSHARRIFLMT